MNCPAKYLSYKTPSQLKHIPEGHFCVCWFVRMVTCSVHLYIVCGLVIQLSNALCLPLSQFTYIGVKEINAVQALAPVNAALDATE